MNVFDYCCEILFGCDEWYVYFVEDLIFWMLCDEVDYDVV